MSYSPVCAPASAMILAGMSVELDSTKVILTPVSSSHCFAKVGMAFLNSDISSIVSDGFFRLFFLMYSFAPVMARSSTVAPGNTCASTGVTPRLRPSRSSSTLIQPRRITVSYLRAGEWESGARSLVHGRLVTTAGADLMQLNDIAKWVTYKNLIGGLSHQPLNLPVPDTTLVELALGLLNVFDCQGYVRYRGVFDITARHGRPAFCAHEVDLGRVLVVPHKDPKTWNARNSGSPRIAFQPQHVRIKLPGLFHRLSAFANANAMMVEFEYFNGHRRFPLHR